MELPKTTKNKMGSKDQQFQSLENDRREKFMKINTEKKNTLTSITERKIKGKSAKRRPRLEYIKQIMEDAQPIQKWKESA